MMERILLALFFGGIFASGWMTMKYARKWVWWTDDHDGPFNLGDHMGWKDVFEFVGIMVVAGIVIVLVLT